MIDHDGLSAWRLDHAWVQDHVQTTAQKVQAALDALHVVRKIELVEQLMRNALDESQRQLYAVMDRYEEQVCAK